MDAELLKVVLGPEWPVSRDLKIKSLGFRV